jgi:hypothetical protein
MVPRIALALCKTEATEKVGYIVTDAKQAHWQIWLSRYRLSDVGKSGQLACGRYVKMERLQKVRVE